MEEVYVSTDIETDGPIPAINSMLSLASAAFTLKDGLIATYSVNLDFYPGAIHDPETMTEFWDKHPEAWAACRENPQPIEESMKAYVAWLNALPGKPVFVGYPTGFDFTHVYWYIRRYGLKSPFGFAAMDTQSYMAGMQKIPFRDAKKKNMPKSWFPEGTPNTHVALEDAIEQGHIHMNMLHENLGR